MKISERFVNNESLSKGERSLLLRRIPVNAKITKAKATVKPTDSFGRIGPSDDDITFNSSNKGDNGETISRVFGAPGWIEINFHRRVHLISVAGTDLDGATLQVDIGGGSFIEVNDNGAFKGPSEAPFTLTNSGFQFLPGLEVNRMRLTQATGLALDITSIRVRNTASNIALRIGESAPFFAQPGDLVENQSSQDFSQMLQSSLADAKQENGFYVLPFGLSSDRLSRVELELDIEFVNQQSVLPDRLSSITLPYAYNGVSEAVNPSLNLTIPVGARLISADTIAKIEGSFTDSTIAQGNLDQPNNSTLHIPINSAITEAQAFSVLADTGTSDITVDSLDFLLTAVSPQARLQFDIRADLDGKPDSISLLSKMPELSISTDNFSSPKWLSAPLSTPIKLLKLDPSTSKPVRYWLILQSLEGDATWSISDSAKDPLGLLQQSSDGGLSWRENVQTDIVNQAYAAFRLRQKNETFKIPLEVKIGIDDRATRLKLDKFEPLGRIDFELDSEALAGSVNGFLDTVEKERCPEGEQLLNADFQLALDMPSFTLLGWEQIGPGLAPSGSPLDAIVINSDIDTGGISQTTSVTADCHYELSAEISVEGEDARIEMIWRGNECNVLKTDTLSLPEGLLQSEYRDTPIHRLRVQAPKNAVQVEVRLIVPESSSVLADKISLFASPQAILNNDLLEGKENAFIGWQLTPSNAISQKMFVSNINNGQRVISNKSDIIQPITLTQKAAVKAGQSFTFTFAGKGALDTLETGLPPEVHVNFLNEDNALLSNHPALIIAPDSAENHVLTGTIPDTATQAEIKLSLPQSTTLTIRSVSLINQELQDVPITFLSQAPGDLTVTDLTIGFETQPAPPLALPVQGFCEATPASELAGEECCEKDCDEDCSCFCNRCKKKTSLERPKAVLLPGDRPATVGLCQECGLPLLTNTGLLVHETISIPIRRIDRSFIAEADADIALTDVAYIGEVRAQRLQENGLSRVNQLATANTDYLAEVLEVNTELAESFVTQAKKLLVERQLKTAHISAEKAIARTISDSPLWFNF